MPKAFPVKNGDISIEGILILMEKSSFKAEA